MDDLKINVAQDLVDVSLNKSLDDIFDGMDIPDIDFPEEDIEKNDMVEEFFFRIENFSLWRMVGSKPPYYKLKDYEKDDRSISLFFLKDVFIEAKKEGELDCWFLQFMFWVVMKDKMTAAVKKNDTKYFDGRRSAILIMRKLKQLAMSDDLFFASIECIEVSLKQTQDYFNFADHWDLKYKNSEDDDKKEVQEMLYNATEVFGRKDHFDYMRNQLFGECIANAQ